MNCQESDNALDEALVRAFGSQVPGPDFSRWREAHPEAVQKLESLALGQMPVRTTKASAKRKHMTRTIKERISRMNRIPRIAAAIFVVTAVVGIAAWLTVGGTGVSVSFAQVIEQVRAAETATYTVTIQAQDGSTSVVNCMLMEPGHVRLNWGEALTWVSDYSKGKMLVLDRAKKKGMSVHQGQGQVVVPNMIEQLKTIRAEFEEEESLGSKDIDGREAVGFLVHKDGKDITIWVDPDTALPVRIEVEEMMSNGSKVRFVAGDFEFNAHLDESLFSTDLPEGYTKGEISSLLSSLPGFPTGSLARGQKLAKRAASAANLARLQMACSKYAKQNDGKWPNSLEALVGQYGITAKHLVNPNEKDRKIGYVYLKPTEPLAPQQLLMYEAHDWWPDGINVVLGHGHVEFITDEDDFKQLLSSTKSE